MKIILVRHGEANPDLENLPLTEKGVDQAKIVSKELEKYSFDKIFSSGLLRAKQTCEKFTKDYVEDERLNEIYRVLVGGPVREGTPENREEEDKINADSIFDYLINLDYEKVLVFCHGNVIRYFIKKINNLENENLWKDMKIDNCSMTIIEKNLDGLKVKEINKNDYLFGGKLNID